MDHHARTIAALTLVALLGACKPAGQEQAAGTPTALAAGEKPPPAFAQCMSCHSVEPGRNLVGPSLHGVVGRKAASLPGFAYSPALRASGLTWDEGTLDTWLASPAQLVPGTRMVFYGLPDPARRKQVIDYLARQR